MQEVVFIKHFRRCFRILIISFHGIITTVTHFTLYPNRTFFTCFRINHLHLRKFEIMSYRITTYIERIINTGGRHTGSGFCQSVDAGHLHIHLLFHLLHQFDRTQRTCHNTCTKTRHIKEIEHRMMQLGDKHSRHTIKSRTTFFMNRGQHNQRVETFYHHLCTTMSQTVHGSQYYPKTMEQRNATTKFVICRELHVFPRQKSIIGDIIMCQHHPFREAGSARCILHIYYIVTIHFAF